MPSLRARLVEFALPLLGVKRFFSEPDRLDERIAKLRRKTSPRPARRWHNHFEIAERTSQGVPVVEFSRPDAGCANSPHILYLHGGGYVMDIAAIHWDAIGKLCNALDATASVPIYPLAPEVKADQTLAAMHGIYAELAQKHGAQNLVVMGDSAGAGMALALAQMLAKEGAPLPSSLVLFSPWLDATASGEGQAAIESRDKMLAIAGLKACAERYAGTIALDDPRLSPLFGPLDGLPPIATFAGTHDILLVDAQRLDEKQKKAGRSGDIYREYDAMFHDWMLFPIPEGERALEETAGFIRDHHHKGAA